MTLTSVVLPAPLGPMRPWIAPFSTSSDTPSTARTPPKWRWTLSSRSSTDLRSGPPAGSDNGKAAAADDSLRPEDDDRDQNHTAHDVAVVETLEPKDLRERGQEHGPDHRSEDVAASAQDRKREDLHGARHAVLRVAWVDEEVEMGFETTGDRCEGRAEDEGKQLVAGYVDPLAQRCQLVLADGRPGVAQPALGQAPEQENNHGEGDQNDIDAAKRVGLWVLYGQPL